MNCPQCRKKTEESDKYCAFCGATLIPDQPIQQEIGKNCQKCGEPIGKNDKFCGSCGETAPRQPSAQKKAAPRPGRYPYTLATFFGYSHILFGILMLIIGAILIFLEAGDVGSVMIPLAVLWFGIGWIVYGIYLWSRKHYKAKFHGKVIFILSFIFMFLSFFLIYVLVE